MLDIRKFRELIEAFHEQLLETDKAMTQIKLAEDKWSLAEIVGHLIDSASNNQQRFVRLQFDDLLDFPAYDGETWIRVQDYNHMDWNMLVTFWYNYNNLLLHTIEKSNKEALEHVWVNGEATITLEELINDYYRHLKIHIEHFNNRLKELTK